MHKDVITLILAVPLAVIGGIATIWFTLELQTQTQEPLLVVSFAAFAVFFFLAAIALAVQAAMEVYSSE